MLTKRKKQNLLFFSLGVIIGMMIAGFITYYSVIKQFTKYNINRIQSVLPIMDKDTTINNYNTSEINSDKKTNSNKNNSITQEAKPIFPDSIRNNSFIASDTDEIIKTDTKIASSILTISYIESDSIESEENYISEITVEQWENPTNFAGYRKNKNTLIVYGIPLDEIELQNINGTLFLIFKDHKLAIKESNTFIRFPASFIAK